MMLKTETAFRLRTAATLALFSLVAARVAAAPEPEVIQYQVAGLQAPGEILVDKWGIPHIYAKSQYDAFFVQGFNAARDRLWQIDFWRKRGLGELSSTFGPAYVEHDRAARLLVYRGDMYREWLAYGSDAKRVAQAFVNGVNAYVIETRKHPELLPIEFRKLGYEPAMWNADDVVRIRAHGLTRNATSEVTRSRVACKADVDVDQLRSPLEPKWQATVPPGLDPCSIPAGVMAAYTLATSDINFPKAALSQGATPDVARMLAQQDSAEPTYGSNNWVIAPSRTKTGRPILANDPHRAYSSPSLRYIAHISAPGMDVIGAGEPFLPGISIGHNDRIAFGLTIFRMDQEDVFFYETNPENRNEYKYRGRWEPLTIVRETVMVKGAGSQVIETKYTRHGPVIYEDAATGRAYVLRAAWLDTGMAPYFGSIDYMRAQNWDQFQGAMTRWGAPSENQVYADTAGNIGWIPAGLLPVRPNWDGLMPVPGDGTYEWAGYRDNDQLPREFNPSRGWIATANNMTLPASYPADNKVGFEWADPSRITRISEVLSAPGKMDVAESMRLQTDYYSIHAKRIVALLKGLKSDDAAVQQALDMLRSWDFIVQKESATAALYEVWFSTYLKQAVIARVTPADVKSLIGDGDPRPVLAILESTDARLGPNPSAVRDEVLLTSLRSAMAAVTKAQGPDPKAWQWGKLHHAFLSHPLSNLLSPTLGLDVGPLTKSGDEFTVNSSVYRRSDFRLMSGPSFRMVLDVGGWDNSRVINTPGQSGDPTSPHYRDMAAEWEAGRYVPLLYSREAVNRAAALRIKLEPAK